MNDNKNRKKDTNMTQGKPLKIILKFMFPIYLGNIFQQFYNMVDTIIVGKFVGAQALAGVGSTGTIMFLVIGFSIGIATGFSVLTSQKYGAGDEEGTRRSVANGIILSAIFSLIITILSTVFMHDLLHLMNTPADIYNDAYAYIITICRGVTATVFYNLFSAYLRAIGNSRTPLYFLIFSSLLNIVLDLTFIIVLGRGTGGAAEATILSQAISAVLCLIYIMRFVPTLRPHRKHWRLNMDDTRGQLGIGLPMAAQYGITASGTIIMQSAINIFGSTAVAAFTAASKSQNILMQGFISIGLTMASYSGQNYGYGDINRVEQGTRDAMKFVAAYSVIAAGIAIIGFRPLIQLFFNADVDLATIYPWARIYVYECITCYIPLGMIFVYRNTMQGCGYSLQAMTLGIVELIARTIAAMLAIVLHFYPLASGADPFAWLTAGIFAWFMYRHVLKKIKKRLQGKQIKDFAVTP